jgi:hypothetical protein
MLAIGRHLVEPYCFAYATAAAHYRFTAQSRSTAWIATTKTVGHHLIRGTNFRFVCLIERKFFGYQPTPVFDEEVNMSDPEKTCEERLGLTRMRSLRGPLRATDSCSIARWRNQYWPMTERRTGNNVYGSRYRNRAERKKQPVNSDRLCR